MEADIREYLKKHLLRPDDLPLLVAGTGAEGVHPNKGWTFDAEIGFIHAPSTNLGSGIDGTNVAYDYEPDGARKLINCANRPSRIHTYGDSFTHCDQVNDGETWQECLAAHLQEPIRNYGVGAFSVYQAYRRIRTVWDNGEHAKFIILNIFDDDHYRNLVWHGLNIFAANLVPPWPGTPYLPTRPHLGVDVRTNTCVELDNPIASADDLNLLCDLDFVYSEFGDDPWVYLAMAKDTEGDRSLAHLDKACEGFGLAMPPDAAENIATAAQAVFAQAALFSTQKVVELIERFCASRRIKLMCVLSYRQSSILSMLDGGGRFDQDFVDWLKRRPYPVIDMGESFQAEFEHSNLDSNTFVKKHYIGHHTPLGNNFTAWTTVDEVVNWLNPKPASYLSRRDM